MSRQLPTVIPTNWQAMHWLIDGYNMMYAGGRLGPKLSREGFRRARRRFLDELSAALGPHRALQTTVVFDASVHPGDFALDAQYRGLGILFALGDENADARIEQLIAQHARPKMLTVVSSDHRIRQAADRRRAKSLTADQFWEFIDDLKERGRIKLKVHTLPKKPAPSIHAEQTTRDETAHWTDTFRDVDLLPEIQESISPNEALLTDADIAEIERQVRLER
jgi:predicted RNA-binding protein with PIN domain